MNKIRIATILGLALLISGIWLLLDIRQSQQLTFQGIPTPPAANTFVPATSASEIEGQPSELLIPSLKIDISIIPGYYNSYNQTWTLTSNHVQYATITPPPNNEEGNTFLYGHDINPVFARLHNIPANAQAIIKTSNNHIFYYQLASIRTTDPLDDSVFTYHGKPILTLQTCTGVFYQYREFFSFNLVEVS